MKYIFSFSIKFIRKTKLHCVAVFCSGWICYAEKTHGEFILPHISTTRSPQQMMGSLVKGYFAEQQVKFRLLEMVLLNISMSFPWCVYCVCSQGLRPEQIYHVAVMPCFDKKLEASRSDFYLNEAETREVDCVITSGTVTSLLLWLLSVCEWWRHACNLLCFSPSY